MSGICEGVKSLAGTVWDDANNDNILQLGEIYYTDGREITVPTKVYNCYVDLVKLTGGEIKKAKKGNDKIKYMLDGEKSVKVDPMVVEILNKSPIINSSDLVYVFISRLGDGKKNATILAYQNCGKHGACRASMVSHAVANRDYDALVLALAQLEKQLKPKDK